MLPNLQHMDLSTVLNGDKNLDRIYESKNSFKVCIPLSKSIHKAKLKTRKIRNNQKRLLKDTLTTKMCNESPEELNVVNFHTFTNDIDELKRNIEKYKCLIESMKNSFYKNEYLDESNVFI